MINKKNIELLKKQHYGIIGKHSVVQICRWTKNSLRGAGVCYKEKFYGIKSHKCAEMSPSSVWCDNKCVHCWRAIEHTQGNKIEKVDNPEYIITGVEKERKKLLTGFKGNKKADIKRWLEAQTPSHYAISLIGEPTLYPLLPELIKNLKEQGKTSFLVTNGLHPEMLKKLEKQNSLPTQLYLSLNSPNKESYKSWHNSKLKDAWKRFNHSLSIMSRLKNKTRTVIRMTLIKDINMKEGQIKEYAKLIKKANPLFIEVKGFISVGYARKRFGYEKMPDYAQVKGYAEKIAKAINYIVINHHVPSKIVLLGKEENRKRMKIKSREK